MKLVRVTKSSSPDRAGFIRATGTVRMATGDDLEIWFEVPDELRDELSGSANPWILAMLPYAVTAGQTIESDLPGDPELLENLKGLIAVWRDWYPTLHESRIECPLLPPADAVRRDGLTAAFFSGGVDSWFTLLRHAPELESTAIGRVDDLITVHGFDIPLEAPEEFAKLEHALSTAARELGRRSVVVRTNLRKHDSVWARGWGWLAHGAGLSAVALMLEHRYAKALIGSTHPYGALIPWGSHPLTDGLFSTTGLRVKHDGASFNRVEKTRLLARHPIALDHLHVCWKTQSASNCGRCTKCLRTMATLQLLGKPTSPSPFPNRLDPEDIAALYLEDDNEIEFFREVLTLAGDKNDERLEAAIRRSLRRSASFRPVMVCCDKLSKTPGLWRIAAAMRNRLLAHRHRSIA